MEDVVAAGHKCQFVCLLLDFKGRHSHGCHLEVTARGRSHKQRARIRGALVMASQRQHCQ